MIGGNSWWVAIDRSAYHMIMTKHILEILELVND